MFQMRSVSRNRIGLTASAVLLLSALGCAGGASDDASREDRRDTAAASSSAGSPPSLVDSRGNRIPPTKGAPAPASEASLQWTAPAAWIPEPPASAMRKAQYSLPPAPGDHEPGQCAVFYFGAGQGGEVRANVDRWASQFTEASGGHPSPEITEGKVSGMNVMRVITEGTYTPSPMMGGDMTPKPGSMLLGAIVEAPEANWFFKCTGAKKTMETHRKEFDALIDSIHTR